MREVIINTDEIVGDAVAEGLATPDCGAVLTFLGVVRNRNDGRDVDRIDYSCYEEMAGKELRAVVERVADAHGVPRVRVVHRIGELGVGEASLGVACASVHRKESFACALEIIDELKKSVPIWKKEMGPEGTSWV